MKCLCCPNPVKERKNKYCSRACHRKVQRLIDPLRVLVLRGMGLTFTQLEAYFPATASGIKDSLRRYRARCAA